MKTICFDLDGVICSQTGGDYENAAPQSAMIELVNRLYDEGYRIIIHTARFMGRTGGDSARAQEMGGELTRRQLDQWGLRFHELHLGKPSYDLVVDDRAVFFDADCGRIYEEISARLGGVRRSDGQP